MPSAKRNAHAEYIRCHIPAAVFFDLDLHSDTTSSYPHMLPDGDGFSSAMQQLGIHNSDHVVVYDTLGMFSAARLWWMMRVFGHCHVSVLDGGFPLWQQQQHPVSDTPVAPATTDYHAVYHPNYVRDKIALQHNLATQDALVLDARSAARFLGDAPEPRPNLPSGHIPRSVNIPFDTLLCVNGTFKPREKLSAILSATQDRSVISSCGSGVTACIIDLALEIIGHRNHAVYDGAWAEWGADPQCPIATGIADS